MCAEASSLAANGIYVLPLIANGKAPATPNGFKDATTDPKRVEDLWGLLPESNIGIATGASGLVVIDIDTKHGVNGWRAFDDCLERLGELPGPTRMASTPSGGAHLYFRAPDGFEIRNSAGRLGVGLDVRAHGGYVVAPPSVIDGKRYRWDITEAAKVLPDAWAEAMQPPKREPSPPPTFVREPNMSRVQSYSIAAMQDEARAVAGMRTGRNDELVRSASRLGGLVYLGGISADDVLQALLWACSTWPDCDPRKDRDTIERGIRFGLDHPREWREDGEAA